MSESAKYRLVLNGIPDTLRDTWNEAAKDAVEAGVGRWKNEHELEIDYPSKIEAVRVTTAKLEG